MEVCCQEKEEGLDYNNPATNDSETTVQPQPECPQYFEAWGRKCYHFSPSVDQSGNSVVYLTWNQAKVGLRYVSSPLQSPALS